jgi:hypothetical protein
VTSNLKHRHAFDANFVERGFHRVQFRILNNRLDLGHVLFFESCSASLTPSPRQVTANSRRQISRQLLPIVFLFRLRGEILARHWLLLSDLSRREACLQNSTSTICHPEFAAPRYDRWSTSSALSMRHVPPRQPTALDALTVSSAARSRKFNLFIGPIRFCY